MKHGSFLHHPDSLTIAVALNLDLILERQQYFADVEYHGHLTRGYSLVDTLGTLGHPANAEVVLRADQARFREMVITLLQSV